MKPVKKLLAMALAAIMLLSISFTAAATEPTETTENKDASISDMMNLGSVNPLTGKETAPFVSSPDSPVLMSKENELLLYTSNKKGLSAKDDFTTVFEKMTQSTSYAVESNTSPELDLFFVTAVALNASGDGTDDHIAYLGVKAFDKNDGANAKRAGEQVLMLVLYNARRKTTVATMELGSVKAWVNQVEQYAYKTFFSVTAGDYDGDGMDEIACTDHDMGVQMIEINKNDNSKLTLSKGKRYDWTELVSASVAGKMKKSVTASGEIQRRALISLATGNPENYFTHIRDGEYISQGTYALGHNGGYTTSEFSYEVEQTYTATYAHGAHIEIEGTAKTAAVVFSAGAFAETSFQETCGYGDATINGTGTGGAVANIIPSNYSPSNRQR